MTKKILLVLAGMLIGCAAAVGMETVSAQSDRTTYSGPPESSSHVQYRECFSTHFSRHNSVSADELSSGIEPARMVAVPNGWTPIGGYGTQGNKGMILCR